MNIAYLCAHFSTSGMPAYVLAQAEQAIAKDHNVAIVVFEDAAPDLCSQVEHALAMGITVQFLSRFENPAQALRDFLSKSRPDLIHLHDFPEGQNFSGWRQMLGKADRSYNLVLTVHSQNSTNHIADTWSELKPDRIVAVNEWQAEQMRSRLPEVSIETWEYVPPQIMPIDGVNHRILEAVSFPPVVQIATWCEWKNQAYTLEVAKALPDVPFIFIGPLSDNFSSYWEPLVEVSNLLPNTHIADEQSLQTIREVLKESCALIHPTTADLEPIALCEAKALGVPIIANFLPTFRKSYSNADRAIDICIDNPQSAVNAIMPLLESSLQAARNADS